MKNLKRLRLIPDRFGKGGSKTGIHSFQSQPINDVRELIGMHVHRGRWRRDYWAVNFSPVPNKDTAATSSLSCHAYTYPSLTDPSAAQSLTLLGHNIGGGQSRYWDYTAGATRDTHTSTNNPAVFANIGGRCFVVDGVREGMVLDDRTAAIHTQKNQNLGIGTPIQPLAVSSALPFAAGALASTVVPNLTAYGFAYLYNCAVAASYLHTPNPDSPIGTIKATDKVTVSKVEAAYSAIGGALPVAGNPAADGRTSNDPAVAATAPFTSGGDTISCSSGTSIITRSGAWPVGAGRVAGLRINFNGYSFVLGATDKDAVQFGPDGAAPALGANQAFIIGVYDGPTITGAPFTITGCELSLGVSNTMLQASAGTLGYSQSTASGMVPVLVSAVSNDGIWYAEWAADKVARVTTGGTVTEFSSGIAPGTGVNCCALGSDGNVWFTGTSSILRVTAGGTVTAFTAGIRAGASLEGICAGPDGALWFCDHVNDVIGRCTTDGIINDFAVGAHPNRICLGPDGALWFTLDTDDKIGRLTTAGIYTTFSVPTAASAPFDICTGPDGNLWFTERFGNNIGRITPGGSFTEFAIPTAGSAPRGICTGGDGNLWFCEYAVGANKIGKVTTAGIFTEYAVTTAAANPFEICLGPDGNVWFTENAAAANNIGKITPAGVITEYAIPTAAAQPRGIVSASRIRNLGNITLSGTGTPISPAPWSGPSYAYAWYDPETGHISNASPLLTLPAQSASPANSSILDYRNVTPYFQIDAGSISYPSGVDATRFSHIVFFRTLSAPGSSTYYPIGSMQPFVAKVHPGSASTRGSWNPLALSGWMGLPNVYTDAPPAAATPNYWFDFSSDADLLVGGGFRMPQETNAKPMVTLAGGQQIAGYPAHMSYWDGRVWLVLTQEPDTILFSADEAQAPMGQPTECFPPRNRLKISASDGKVTGMRTVGEMNLILTERWAYTVVGNNETNYRLVRISASMPGVGTYQLDEMTSGAEGSPSTVYFYGRDKVLYRWIPWSEPQPVSQPVQNVLDLGGATLASYQRARVHCASIRGRRVVVVTVDPAIDIYPLVFDVENGVWNSDYGTVPSTPNKQPSSYCSVYGLDPPVSELMTLYVNPTGYVQLYSWLRDDGTTVSSSYPSYLRTFPIDFDGMKTRKQLVGVNAHVSGGAAGAWRVNVYPDEGAAVGPTTLTAYGATAATDANYSIYRSGGTPVDSSTAQDLQAIGAAFYADGKAVVGYRFVIELLCTAQVTAPPGSMELYALDLYYSDWQEAGEADV